MRYSLRTLLVWTTLGPPLLVAALSVTWATLNAALMLNSSRLQFSRLPGELDRFCMYGLGVTLPAALVLFLAAVLCGPVSQSRASCTLLIVVSVLAIGLARVAYLKQQRDLHRQEVQKLLPQLAQAEEMREQDVAIQLADIATIGPLARGSWIGGSGGSSQGNQAEFESTLTAWDLARQHELLAARFNRAIYRPWAFVWDDPDSVPDEVRLVDSRLAVLLPLVALVMLGARRVMRRLPCFAPEA